MATQHNEKLSKNNQRNANRTEMYYLSDDKDFKILINNQCWDGRWEINTFHILMKE